MSDMLSQEEIDALLKGSSGSSHDEQEELDADQRDTLGEIGNISMGTSATTLFTLLGQKVIITTPKVSVLTMDELARQYPIPFVVVEVQYKEGIQGTNLLVLQQEDVKIITDLMMGGDGSKTQGELSELHLSAIGEAMNQMVGSASTSLSEMFHNKIDINPPKAMSVDFSTEIDSLRFAKENQKVVKIAFRMVVGDIIDSEIMQIIPIKFAKDMVNTLLNASNTQHEEMINSQAEKHNAGVVSETTNESIHTSPKVEYTSEELVMDEIKTTKRSQPVKVQPVQFQSFDQEDVKASKENISLIKDVPLEITVELGRTVKKISEILEFSPGTVVELDKLVGEPLDILVNGQFMAKGEVVVIDENYGIRITDIVHPATKNKMK